MLHVVSTIDELVREHGTTGLLEPGRSDEDYDRWLAGILGESGSVRRVESIRVSPDPAAAIAQYASKHEIELIVMGTHGRSGLTHLLVGSVTERSSARHPARCWCCGREIVVRIGGMELSALLDELARPEAFPYPVAQVEVRQTHISIVFLAGSFVYKIKKPVNFGWVDFATLEKRLHFCQEEVRLNRRLAPDVVPRRGTGSSNGARPAIRKHG